MNEKDYYYGFLSTAEVADKLKCERSSVLSYINMGLLPATNLSNGTVRPRWGIRSSDFYEFKKTYRKHYTKITTGHRGPYTKTERPEKPKKLTKEDEIKALKEKLRKLSDDLLEISARLEELAN